MQRSKNKKNTGKITTLNGMMSYSKINNKLNILDFASTECAEVEPFIGTCKVQTMRNGDVYITELPKRVRNKALFRDDNCSLTLGRDGRYYFVFSMPEEGVKQLPHELVRQALTIAQKVERMILKGKEVKR